MRITLLLIPVAAALAAPAHLPLPGSQDARMIAAVRGGGLANVRAVLSAGANPDATDPEGTPALMLAAHYAPAAAVEELLRHGANPNARNANGATALIWAAGDLAKVKALLTRGADVNARSNTGRTALLAAAAHDGSHQIVRLLLDRGADIEARDTLKGFLPTGGGGDTPLIEAAKGSDLRTARLLLERGAKVNATSFTGGSALIEAALRGNVPMARLLLDHGANLNHTVPGMNLTPALAAGVRASSSMLYLLATRGADINKPDAFGNTPLMWAAASDRMGAAPIAVLLQAGANPRVVNKDGESALDWAAKRHKEEVMELLERAGAPRKTAVAIPAAFNQGSLDARTAVERSVATLNASAPRQFKIGGCATCHHQTLPLELNGLARAHGLASPPETDQKQVQAIRAFLKPLAPALAESSDILPEMHLTASYALIALAAQNYAPDGMTAAATHAIAARQWRDGSWITWAPRPPIEEGDIQATAMALRALQIYGAPGRRAEFRERIERARAWLLKARPVTTEDKAMRLFGLAWSGMPHARARRRCRCAVARTEAFRGLGPASRRRRRRLCHGQGVERVTGGRPAERQFTGLPQRCGLPAPHPASRWNLAREDARVPVPAAQRYRIPPRPRSVDLSRWYSVGGHGYHSHHRNARAHFP